ncbi:hypothetical protein [Streptomyces sp. SID1121]|uniref:hypothetical protein n=1 Tax=Streptomyces sp. SID1121 TaxID=3425888 RepID=UPI00405717A5
MSMVSAARKAPVEASARAGQVIAVSAAPAVIPTSTQVRPAVSCTASRARSPAPAANVPAVTAKPPPTGTIPYPLVIQFDTAMAMA